MAVFGTKKPPGVGGVQKVAQSSAPDQPLSNYVIINLITCGPSDRGQKTVTAKAVLI